MWKFLTISRILMEQANPDGGAGGTGGTTANLLGGDPPAPAEGGTPAAQGNPEDTDWMAGLPEDLKDDATLKNFKDLKSLAAAHVALKKHLGSEKIALPGKNATDDDWKALFTKLGVPEKLEDYKIGFKKEAVITEEFTKDFANKLHSLGIIPKQAQALADWVSDMNIANTTKFTQERVAQQTKDIEALKKEWGTAFDPYLARANKLLKEYGDDDTIKFLTTSGLANDTKIIKLLAKAANAIYKEDGALEGSGGNGTRRMTPADARAEANKIIGDFKHPYHIKDHPNHKNAVEEVAKLFEQAASQG